MTRVMVYEDTEKQIRKVCEDNDISEAELIEMLMEYIEEVKENNELE